LARRAKTRARIEELDLTETRRPTADELRAKLEAAFHPDHLEVIDESELHRGHAGWREGGSTHFRVVMRAAALGGLSRVERSRAVHRALADEIAAGVHALALDLSGG
jgi:BolA protein